MSWTEEHNERVDRRLQQIQQMILECPHCQALKDVATKLVGLRGPEPLIVNRSQVSDEVMQQLNWIDLVPNEQSTPDVPRPEVKR